VRSAASVRGHPIHPALIPFPIAFLLGALLFDVIGLAAGAPSLWQTGWYLNLAGVIAAVVAAAPGVMDYIRTVPPRSSAKQRATRHGLANIGATVLYTAALLVRGEAVAQPGVLTVALQLAGAVLLAMGGWMGGTLVYRNQIGVDHRFAGAGKWSEARFGKDAVRSGRVDAARQDELDENQMKLLIIDDERIVLARTADGYVAFSDRCTHKGGSLAGGAMICGRVQCPWHGSQFDTRDGSVHQGPAEERIRTYPVEVEGDVVRVLVR